jgi:hypothetical protein
VITRIEIDGFKSFMDFQLNLEPFTVLAGANNSGKSNLLEAITLLDDLVDLGSASALTKRRSDGRSRGRSLFHAAGDGTRRDVFRLAVVVDGSLSAEVSVQRGDPGSGFSIASMQRAFRDEASSSGSTRSDFMSVFVNRVLDPAPGAMRSGADIDDDSPLAASGENLAAVVARIQGAEGFPQFLIDACYVLGEVTAVRVVKDERRKIWDLEIEMRGGRVFTPAEVSDGTLRVLCLLAAAHDPSHGGTVLIEEIENGLDPRYLGRLVERLTERIRESGKVQIIATTHSPVIVGETKRLSPESVYLFGIAAGPTDYAGERKLDYFTHARGVVVTGERGTFVPPSELDRYVFAGSRSEL